MVELEFDPAKAAANRAGHGGPMELARWFDWTTALVQRDMRRSYGEDRFVAIGTIFGRAHVMVLTPRGGAVRIISLRKANEREIARYHEQA